MKFNRRLGRNDVVEYKVLVKGLASRAEAALKNLADASSHCQRLPVSLFSLPSKCSLPSLAHCRSTRMLPLPGMLAENG